MKTVFATLIGVCFTSGALAAGNRIECRSVIEGEEVGGRFETSVTFDSAVPACSSVFSTTLTGQPPMQTKVTYLAEKSVCGLPLDFSKDCQARERFDPRFGYAFTFTCGSEVTRGEIYCDEDCVAGAGGMTLECQGPKIDRARNNHSFDGCKFKKGS